MIRDKIGKVFNRLTIVAEYGKYKNGTKTFLCKCNCGGQAITSYSHLKTGHVKSCGCLSKEAAKISGEKRIRPMIGKKIGRLEVIESAGKTKNGTVKWKCMCDCGNEKIVSGSALRRGSSKSCGCLHKEMVLKRNNKRFSKEPWKVEMTSYIIGARNRDLLFSLTKNEFKALATSDCFYCGQSPKMKCKSKILKNMNTLKNGIDRVNSDLGYRVSNCVSCCSTCNYQKSNNSIDEFINSTIKRYLHLKKKGIIK